MFQPVSPFSPLNTMPMFSSGPALTASPGPSPFCGCRDGMNPQRVAELRQLQMLEPMLKMMGNIMQMMQTMQMMQMMQGMFGTMGGMPFGMSGGMPFGMPGGMPFATPGGMPGISGGGPCGPVGSIPGGSNASMTRLAQLADNEVRTNPGRGGQCFNRVANSLDKMGIRLSGNSAYMAADQLARHPKVQEIQVSREQLSSLPPGAIVVWDKCKRNQHGHISVSLGGGREASCIYRKQLTNYGPRFRVFIPR